MNLGGCAEKMTIFDIDFFEKKIKEMKVHNLIRGIPKFEKKKLTCCMYFGASNIPHITKLVLRRLSTRFYVGILYKCFSLLVGNQIVNDITQDHHPTHNSTQ